MRKRRKQERGNLAYKEDFDDKKDIKGSGYVGIARSMWSLSSKFGIFCLKYRSDISGQQFQRGNSHGNHGTACSMRYSSLKSGIFCLKYKIDKF